MMMDILFFAIVAIFFAVKLYSTLGKGGDETSSGSSSRNNASNSSYDDSTPNYKNAADSPMKLAEIINIGDRRQNETGVREVDNLTSRLEELESFAYPSDEVKEALHNVIKLDKNFSIHSFTEGAKKAIEMLFKAYTEEDKSTIRFLTSDDVYEMLSNLLDNNKSQGLHESKSLIAISVQEITNVQLVGNTLSIKLKFYNEEINFTKNKDGEVVSGYIDHIDEDVEDFVTFEKNIKSNSPNWKITKFE